MSRDASACGESGRSNQGLAEKIQFEKNAAKRQELEKQLEELKKSAK